MWSWLGQKSVHFALLIYSITPGSTAYDAFGDPRAQTTVQTGAVLSSMMSLLCLINDGFPERGHPVISSPSATTHSRHLPPQHGNLLSVHKVSFSYSVVHFSAVCFSAGGWFLNTKSNYWRYQWTEAKSEKIKVICLHSLEQSERSLIIVWLDFFPQIPVSPFYLGSLLRCIWKPNDTHTHTQES